MALQVYCILIMFAVAASAYATAINARGVVRVTLSYVLATLILIFAVFTAVRYNQDIKAVAAEADRVKLEEQIKKTEMETRAAIAKQVADSLSALQTEEPVAINNASPLAGEGLSLANAILAVDVNDESLDYDQLVAKAQGFQAQAAALKRKADGAAKTGTPAEAQIDKGVRFLSVAATTLSLYFKAENETEENERLEVYKQNGAAAKAAFSKALGR